jgi:hypothetical protein
MNVVEATTSYEHWLAQEIPIDPRSLEAKHAGMAAVASCAAAAGHSVERRAERVLEAAR